MIAVDVAQPFLPGAFHRAADQRLVVASREGHRGTRGIELVAAARLDDAGCPGTFIGNDHEFGVERGVQISPQRCFAVLDQRQIQHLETTGLARVRVPEFDDLAFVRVQANRRNRGFRGRGDRVRDRRQRPQCNANRQAR